MDKNLKFYWCRTRVKGTKRLRNTETLEDEISGAGELGDKVNMPENAALSVKNLGISCPADVEMVKSEASTSRGNGDVQTQIRM